MARLESIAVGGYYPTPPSVVALIAGMLEPQSNVRHNIVDPCAGEGAAVFGLAQRFGTGATVYTCEMERTRHAALKARAEDRDYWDVQQALHGDAFRVDMSEGGAHLLYLNPPYDLDPVHARLEERFLQRFTRALDRDGGLLVFVVPYYALAASADTLAREYELVGCWRFSGPEFAAYKQVVLFARRVSERLEPDAFVAAQVRVWAESVESMTILGSDAAQVEVIGESWCSRMTWEMRAFDTVGLLAKALPWKQRSRPGAAASLVPHVLSDLPVQDLSFRSYPLATPPRPAHIAAGIASGLFNGKRVSGDGPDLLVKGVFDREYRTIEEKKNKDGETTAVVQVQQPKLVTTVLDLSTKQYRTLNGAGLGELLESYGESLMGVMREQCPVLYDPLRHHTDPLAPVARDLFSAQAHAARALVRLLTGPARAAILLGEIGSGKTGTALTAAKTVAPGGRVLVLCPPHLLQSWRNEASAVVPEATVTVLETVADVDAIASTEGKESLQIAVLSRETAKLGHGWVGVDPRLGCPRCGSPISEGPETLAKKRLRCEARPRRAADALARVMFDLALALGPCAPTKDRVVALLQGRSLERSVARWSEAKDKPGWQGMTPELVARAATALFERIATGEFAEDLPRALGHVLLGQPDAAIEATVRALAPAAAERWNVAEVQRGLCVLLSAERAAQLDAEEGLLAKQYYGASKVSDMIEQAARPDYESGYPTKIGRVRRAEGGAVLSLDGHEPGSMASALEALARLSGEWRAPKRPCGEPLYQAIPEPRRVPLASYVAKRHPKAFDLLVLDEGHEYATDGSAQERAAHRLTALGMPTILATGSIMNGYASSLFTNMWAMSADFRREFGRDEQQRFIDRFGYRKRILSEKDRETGKVVEFGSVTDRVERQERMAGDAPGVLPLFLFRHLLGISVTLHKTDLALDLPPCRQIRHDIEPGEDLATEYRSLLAALKSAIKRDQFQPERSGKLFGQLSELPSYLDRAWRDFEVRYPESLGSELVARAESLPGLQAKEAWLIETLRAELAEGRNVMVFTWHVDVLPRLQRLIFDELGEDAPILMADKVPTAKRQAWIDAKIVKPRKRVMLANPVCIQTGLNNLVWFASQVWVENPACNPTIFRQAIGRVDRIGQKASETRIHMPVYVGTLQEQLYSLLLRKVAVAVSADGLDPESALAAAGASDDGYLSGLSLGKQLWEMMVNERPAPKKPAPKRREEQLGRRSDKPSKERALRVRNNASASSAQLAHPRLREYGRIALLLEQGQSVEGLL
jgi:predicted RNA methylase